jgi:tetratricopeptide (TPR) repeat protein
MDARRLALAVGLVGPLAAAALLGPPGAVEGAAVAAASASPVPQQRQSPPPAPAQPDRPVRDAERARLEAAVASSPENPEPRVRLGELLVDAGEDEAALDQLTRGLELGAAGELAADAHLAAAAIERRHGALDAAIRSYQLALTADSDRLEALAGLASTLAQAGRYRDAIPAYGFWIQERPDDPVPRLGAATAMILAGEHARARIVLEQAHEALPGNLDVLDLLARHLAASPDPAVRDGARAVALALELVEAVPTPESRETLAMAYAEAGRRDDALAVQQRLVDELADTADAATDARLRANLDRYRRGESCCAP